MGCDMGAYSIWNPLLPQKVLALKFDTFHETTLRVSSLMWCIILIKDKAL